MKDEAGGNNLVPYIPGFSRFLNIESEEVLKFIHKHDWEGLVHFLL